MSWPLANLDNHIDILSGFAFKSESFNYRGEGLPLVRIRDVVPGFSDTYYSGEYSSEFLLSDGDMLIGMDGDFNRARWKGGQALLNQRVCKITAKAGSLDQAYLYHFLPKALEKIHAETPAVTVKHLSVKGIRAIEIPLPPLSEQKRIAAALLRNCPSERSYPFPQSAQDTRIVCGVPSRVNWFRIAART